MRTIPGEHPIGTQVGHIVLLFFLVEMQDVSNVDQRLIDPRTVLLAMFVAVSMGHQVTFASRDGFTRLQQVLYGRHTHK